MAWIEQEPLAPRRIGTTGLVVNPIGLDGSVFGWVAGHEDTAAVLDGFHEAGGTLISTADHYAGGRSEIMIGHWVRERGLRESVVLATKVGRHPDADRYDRRTLTRAVEASLERLDTDHIDLLSLDGERPGTDLDELVITLEVLIASGKVGAVGAAGFPAPGVSALVDGGAPVSAVISEYSLMVRGGYENGLDAFALERGTAGVARLPLANGYLTGDFRSKGTVPADGMFAEAAKHVGRTGNRVLDALGQIAGETGSTRAGVAIAWTLTRPGIAATVVRARSLAQLPPLLAASVVHLTPQHLALLDKLSR